MKIYTIIASFTVGVLISSFITITPFVALFIVLVGLAIVFAEKVWKGEIVQPVLLLSIAIISLGLGVLRYNIKDFHIVDETIESNVGETISIEGTIVSEPEQRENSTRFVLKTGVDSSSAKATESEAKLLVSTGLYSPVRYGDRIVAQGKLAKPGIIESDVGRPFDYAKYLSKDDIYYTFSFAKVEVIEINQGNSIKSALLGFKSSLIGKMRVILPEPESSLLAGLIVAGKGVLPKDIIEDFRRAGVVHIVVLSGFNITIIAEFLGKFFGTIFLSLKVRRAFAWSAGFSILGILLFVLMTGAQATVVRASIMALTVVLAKLIGRNYSAHRALYVAGFLMLLENPKILVFDPSFQLSFLATLALIFVAPIIEKYFKRVPEKFGTRTLLVTTIATQIVVLPHLLYSMGRFSVVSVFANMAILFFIPVTMLVGFVGTLVGFVGTYVALPFAYIAHLLLAYILGISSFFGSLPFASIAIRSLPIWFAVFLYVVLVFAVYHSRIERLSPDSQTSLYTVRS